MTSTLSADLIASRLAEAVPGAVEESNERDVWVKAESVLDVCGFLKDDADLKFDYLVSISAVDYIEHFEVVYHLVSMPHNHGAVVRTRCWGREEPSVPSVTGLWQGADFQEREVYDLMGVSFTGHVNLKRLLLWEGYPGHPQRKDYLEPPR
ncbi:MAG: NADH-quinone oxidoreductase subunit C [Chloroflexota bacterium]|nr:NADH-quinone oxidoreductase subunit C [Chloroflexota bacterium]MDE2942073.1 NADH-quinone oxidoreductase subunit C [Chloroflexota bacterium]MDE3268147.1 NADH-quinone oxidoreductase subunit C [Chloroflexota bacterium]